MEEEIIPTSVPGVHIRRDELVRVMLDTLQSMGYRSTAASLERESGLDAATDGSAALRMLRSEVVDGRWSNAIGILLTREAKLASKLEEPVILFAILRQMYLETIESGGTWEALSILREQVQPLLAFIAEICGRPPHRPAAEEMGAGGKRSLFGAKAALSFPASPVFAPLAMPLPHTLSPVNALTTTSKAQRHAHAPTRPGSGSIAVVTATEARQPAGGAPSPPVNVGALFHQAQQLEEATEEEEAESSVQERGVAGPFRVKVKSGAGAGAGGSGGMVVEAGRGEELMSQAGASAGDREDLGLYCLAEPARTTTTAAPTGGTGLQQTADTDAVFSSGRAKRQRIDDIVSIATCGGTIRLSRSEYTKAAAAADASGGGTSLPFDEREREYLGLSSSVTSSSLATGWPAYSALSRPSTLHSLAALTLITDPQQLREAARWSGAKGDSRLALLYLLERRLHPSTVPPLRLPALLGQAVAWQRSLCPLHNDWDGTPSLLRDHVCAKSEVLPSRCVAVLQGHEEEVWGVKLSPDGTLAASYAKDGSVVVWALEAILKAASQAEVQQHWQIEKEEEGGSRAAAFNGQDHRMTEEAADGTPLPRPEASSSTYAVLRISAGADGVSSVGVGTLPRLSMMEPPASSRGTAARSHEGEEGDTAGSGDGTASAASAGRIGGTTYPSGGNGGVHPWTGGLSSRPVLSRWDVKEAPDVLARTGRPQAPPVEVDSSPSADAMTSLAWSSDGSMILTTGTSTTCAYLWAVRTGKLLAAFDAGRENVKGGLSGAAWVGQPSGGDGEAAAHRRFVASAVGGSVWLWSVPTEVVAEAHNPSIGYKPVLVSRPQAQWMTGPTWGLSVALFPKPQTSTGLGATAAAATGAATAAGNGEATATPSLSVFDTVAVLGQEGVLTIINTRDHSAPMLEQSVAVCGYKVTAATMDHTGRCATYLRLKGQPHTWLGLGAGKIFGILTPVSHIFLTLDADTPCWPAWRSRLHHRPSQALCQRRQRRSNSSNRQQAVQGQAHWLAWRQEPRAPKRQHWHWRLARVAAWHCGQSPRL